MELLEKLCKKVAISGNEFNIKDIIVDEIKDFADELKIDALNNIVAIKKGSGKKIMLTANTDEQGGVVTYIENNGHIRFSGLGKLDVQICPYKKVRFSNGVCGVVCIDNKKSIGDCKFSDLYIDIGISGRENVEKFVSIGDVFAIDFDFFDTDEAVFAKVLDNRVGVYALIDAFKNANGKNSVYAVFTAQKNIGFKGAKLCGEYINPDIGISVDMADESEGIKCGEGVVLRARDSAAIFTRKIIDSLKGELLSKNIKFQIDATAKSQTEASAFIASNNGVCVCSVGAAIKNYHTGAEKISKEDIRSLKGALELIINAN